MTAIGQSLDKALAAKDWKTSLSLLKTWTASHPKDANGWFWTAYCLEQLGQIEEAQIAAQSSKALDPKDNRTQKLILRLGASRPSALRHNQQHQNDQVPPTEASPDPRSPATETGAAGPSLSMPSTGSPLWKPGDVVNGRYEVRDVRRGGMGEVYFVFDRALALELAVKTPLPKTLATASGRLRFLREAEAWIGLGLHSNICAAYYLRELGGIARLFIEYIDGDGLDLWMKSERGEGFTQRLDMAIQVASGMQHAHTFEWVDESGNHHQGLAHRDLKPANVLVGSDGLARVTDFGLVGRGFGGAEQDSGEVGDAPSTSVTIEGIWKTVTLGGGLMGTPPYMPPEQWDGGHAAGKPADIYAFGCILFEMFCGRRPFVLSDDERKAHAKIQLNLLEERHRRSAPPRPQAFNDRIDDELGNLMLQCLEKEPTSRPGSFAEIRQRLVDVFAGVTARPYPRKNPQARQLLGDALNNQGMSYATLGQTKRAERAWVEALTKDPRHIEATFNLALFRWQFCGAGDSETISRMEEILRSDRPQWKAHHLLGKLCLAVGDWAKALDHLAVAHRTSGGMSEVARDYAVALCGQTDPVSDEAKLTEAVDILTRFGGPLRSDPILLTVYAFALRGLGQDDKSAKLFKEARRHEPNLPTDLDHGARHLIPGLNAAKRLEGFSGRVLKIAILDTGNRAVTVLQGGAICVWDTNNGQIERMMQPPGGRSRCIELTPDGSSVLATAEGDPITVWSADSGVSQHRLQAHAGFLNSIAVTQTGRMVAGVGTTGSLNVWDFETKSLVGIYPIHSGFLTCVDISADCMTLVTGGSGGKILAVDMTDGEIISRPDRHGVDICSIAISRGGRTAISGDEDGEIRVWNVQEGQTTRTLRGHKGSIRFLSIDDTSSYCLSGDSSGSLRLWDITTGQLLASYSVVGEIRSAAASAGWSTVVVGHGPAGLSLFDFTTIPQPMLTWAVSSPVTVGEADKRAKRFAAHLKGARSLLAEGDPANAIAEIDLARSIPGYGRNDEALSLAAQCAHALPRDGIKGAWADDVFTLHKAKVNCARVSPCGTHVLSVGADRKVLLWNFLDGTMQQSFEPIETPELTVAFLPVGNACITAGLDNVIHLWDISGGNTVRTFEGHQAQINDLACAGGLILSGSSDNTARVWDTDTGVCLQVFDGHAEEIRAVAFSPDARMCASSGGDELLLWDPISGRDTQSLIGHTEPPSALVWSDDGRNLLSAGRDSQLRLWDVSTGNCLRTIDAEESIESLDLSPDDRFALTGCQDGSVHLWDIRSRRRLRTFKGHVGPVSSVAFSVDGQRGLSAGEDGTIRLWYFDWHTVVEKDGGWSEQAKPYLEVFLARHSQGSDGPQWKDEDFRRLLDDLERRRLGRLSPEEVKRNLDQMAAEWTDQSATMTAISRRTRHHRPASATRRKAARKKLIWRAGIAAALLPLILVIWSSISSGRLRIDPEQVNAVQQAALAARIPYGLDDGSVLKCDPRKFRDYLQTFSKGTADPAELDGAGRCLGLLQDSRAVVPLLDLLRPPNPEDIDLTDLSMFEGINYHLPSNSGYVLSVLVAIGDNGCRELKEGLVDREAAVRRVAARALASIASERAISTLLDSADDREPVVRIAVSQTLEAIAASAKVPPEEAFELFEVMAKDTFPEVRRNVAWSLRIFRGSQPKGLLEVLAQDIDEGVRKAAGKTLLEF